jgi:hypothetical protein
MKIEKGVMVMKNGRAWGVEYEDDDRIVYGWIDPENATIYNTVYCKDPIDVLSQDSRYAREMVGAVLVPVVRTTMLTLDFSGKT